MTCLIFAQGQIGGWAGGWGVGMPWNTGVTQWGSNLPWTGNPWNQWQNPWGNVGVNPFPNQRWGSWGNLGNLGNPWAGQRAFFKK